MFLIVKIILKGWPLVWNLLLLLAQTLSLYLFGQTNRRST
jgi:hypothetical protein